MRLSVFTLVMSLVCMAVPATAATKVFLIAGQSNAAGLGGYDSPIPPPYDVAQTDVRFWNYGPESQPDPVHGINIPGVGTGWVNLETGYGHTPAEFGPEVSFGYALKNTFPDDDIYLVKYGLTSSSLAVHWNPWGTGSCYNQFAARVSNAMANLNGAGLAPTIAGMIWMQGESDAMVPAYAAAYETNLRNFINKVRSDVGTAMPFVVGRITDYDGWGTPADNALVRSAQMTVPWQVGTAAWIDTDDLQWAYVGHYGTQGQIDLGTRFATELVGIPDPISKPTTVLFQDDFETASNVKHGAYPDDGANAYPDGASVGTWVPLNSGGLVQVTDYAAPGTPTGNNYLRGARVGPYDHAAATFPVQAAIGDKFSFEFDLYNTDTGSSPGICIADASPGADLLYLYTGAGGTITSFIAGDYSASQVLTVGFTPHQWEHWKIDYTMGAATFDLTVGSNTQTGIATMSGFANAFTQMYPYLHALDNGGMDNVKITLIGVPQPSSLVLLGIGAIGLLAYGRRRGLALTVVLLCVSGEPAGAGEVLASATIVDHADSAAEGSLAWRVARSVEPAAQETHLVLSGAHTYTIGGDLTIPGNVTLTVRRGALVEIKPGATLTINGAIDAGPWKIFDGEGEVAGSPTVDYVRPQWWGTDQAALTAALRFGHVYLGTGKFVIDDTLDIGSDTHLWGEPGCQIKSVMKGNPHSYFGVIGTEIGAGEVRNVSIRGVTFVNTNAVGMYALGLWGGGETIRVTDCESVGCGIFSGYHVKNVTVSDNVCHSSTLETTGAFDDHHDGIYLGGVAEDVIITNNRVLDWRCHGIAVVSEAVFPPASNNPRDEMRGKRILISGNTVIAPAERKTAGGIWTSRVQECRINDNHIENYDDVGIDFEGSRNCIADGNILINNNKNLALFGNCANITFSNNSLRTTDSTMDMFLNTYSNGYKDIVDRQNTDIFVIGNLFRNDSQTFDKTHGTANIIPGTAKRIYFRDNVFINCRFSAGFSDDLESIEIDGNTFFNDYTKCGYAVLHLAVLERDKTEKTPTRNFIIRGNRFTSINDETIDSVVAVDTVGALPGTAPFCDLNVVIEDNIIERETTSKAAITLTDSYNHTHHESMKVTAIVRGNISNSPIDVEGLMASKKTVKLLVQDNL